MATGAARAGGMLKSTGVRRVAPISAAQRDKIDLSKKRLSEATDAGQSNIRPANNQSEPRRIVEVAGQRLRAQEKNQQTSNDSESLEERWASAEMRAELISRNNLKQLEIKKREEEIARLPKEFTYKKPASGIGFYFILLLMVAKDIIAIIIKIIELIGDATVIIGIIVWIVASALDFFAYTCSQLYFFLNGIPMNGKKAKIQVMGMIIEMVPILGFLPTETLALIWVRIEANKEARQRALDDMNERIETLQQEIAELRSDNEVPMQYA